MGVKTSYDQMESNICSECGELSCEAEEAVCWRCRNAKAVKSRIKYCLDCGCHVQQGINLHREGCRKYRCPVKT